MTKKATVSIQCHPRWSDEGYMGGGVVEGYSDGRGGAKSVSTHLTKMSIISTRIRFNFVTFEVINAKTAKSYMYFVSLMLLAQLIFPWVSVMFKLDLNCYWPSMKI